MARVLHLRCTGSDFQADRVADALSRLRGEFDVHTRTLGRGGTFRDPLHAYPFISRQRFALIHVWDTPALSIAAFGSRTPIIYSPSTFPSRAIRAWLMSMASLCEIDIVCASLAQQRAFISLGVAARRCHLIRPPVQIPPAGARNLELRSALRLSEDDVAVLCPGESTRNANHEMVGWVASILHVVDSRFKLLLWGRGSQWRKVQRLAANLRQPALCRVAEIMLRRPVSWDELQSAADLALFTAHRPVAPLALASCLAAGLPLAALASPILNEAIGDRAKTIETPPSARCLAQRVLDMHEQPERWTPTIHRIRETVLELFAPQKCLEQYGQLYRRLALRQDDLSSPPALLV